MLDNSQNPTQNDVSVDLEPTLNTSDNVVQETRKPWSMPTLERALLTVIGFFACFLAFRFGRSLVEWQFGLTISLSAVLAITIPVLQMENKRTTNELSEKRPCSCFFCALLDPLIWIGITQVPIFAVWIVGRTPYKLIAALTGFMMIFVPILYLENERLSSQLSEEDAEPRNLMHALIFIVLAVMIGSVGWIVGTGIRTFIEIAVPKLTLL